MASSMQPSALRKWLKSEYLNVENYFRFGSRHPEHEGASWPLGISLDTDAQLNVIDAGE